MSRLTIISKFESFFSKLNGTLNLSAINETMGFVVGLSGGLDSVVLLDLLIKYKNKLNCAYSAQLSLADNNLITANSIAFNITVVYVDHQLQKDSKDWHKFNRQIINYYNNKNNFSIDFKLETVDIPSSDKRLLGTEAAARIARYNVFEKHINQKNKILLTAHHCDDQAETFLLQLVRGAGPKGLSSMPCIKSFANGLHVRPLLDFSKSELESYAKGNNLKWIEDTTNLDNGFDRNYIRNNIIPSLKRRWPSIDNSIAISAKYCAEHTAVLDEYLAEDYSLCSEVKYEFGVKYTVINLSKIKKYRIEKQKLLVRYWLQQLGITNISRNIIYQVILTCFNSATGSDPVVEVTSNNRDECKTVRKYNDCLYLVINRGGLDNSNCIDIINRCNRADVPISKDVSYRLGDVLFFKDIKLKLCSRFVNASRCDSHGYNNTKITQVKLNALKLNLSRLNIDKSSNITIKFRKGGEKCRPQGRGGAVSLKKLMQEHKIPPWQRDKIPLVYINNEIACVVGVKLCEPFIDYSANGYWVFTYEYY